MVLKLFAAAAHFGSFSKFVTEFDESANLDFCI